MNQTVPSDFTTTSFGELNFFPSYSLTSVFTVPSFSVTETRRPVCSAETRRPCKSSVLPLMLLLGLRNVVTPSALVHFFNSFAGISLKTRKPSGCHTGPSVNIMSPASFCTRASAAAQLRNSFSFLMTKDWASAARRFAAVNTPSKTVRLVFIGGGWTTERHGPIEITGEQSDSPRRGEGKKAALAYFAASREFILTAPSRAGCED